MPNHQRQRNLIKKTKLNEKRNNETEKERTSRLEKKRMNYLSQDSPTRRQIIMENKRFVEQRNCKETEKEKQDRIDKEKERVNQRLMVETPNTRQKRIHNVGQAKLQRQKQLTEAQQKQQTIADSQRQQTRRMTKAQMLMEIEVGIEHPQQPNRHKRRKPDRDITKSTINFANLLDNITFSECKNCNEKTAFNNKKTGSLCDKCKKNKFKFSQANNMDPGKVPDELKDLTIIEEMLISQINPIMSVYRLPKGQTGYKGHVINLPQDISQFVTDLPRTKKDLDVIVLRKQGENNTHKDFRVRRQKVIDALLWLKENNKHYKKITINMESANSLPEDDLMEIEEFDTETDESSQESNTNNAESQNTTNKEIDDLQITVDVNDVSTQNENDDITRTFVPIRYAGSTESDRMNDKAKKVFKTSENGTVDKPLNWPQVDKYSPINEFDTPGYIARAFPALFPTDTVCRYGGRVYQIGEMWVDESLDDKCRCEGRFDYNCLPNRKQKST